MRRFYLPGFVLAAGFTLATAQSSVPTGHNDNARTGLNPNETVLNPITVSSNGFGKLFTQPVDGSIYTQPLVVTNVTIPGKGVHNVVYVGTTHDSLYAFDADSATGSNAAPLWHRTFINPAAGITAPTSGEVASPSGDCQTFNSEVGIIGTPAIDLASQTLYVVARTKEPLPPPNNATYVQMHRLHAVELATGSERSNSPVVIDAIVPGTGDGNTNGFVRFNQVREMQRPGLLLSGGVIYVAFASYCDINPYHGWILGYDAQTLAQVGVFNVSPNGSRGGIWMGGGGVAAASDGSVYCVTGNGTFDTVGTPQNLGDSFIELTSGLAVADYFTPYDQANLDAADDDLGAGGVVVLPDAVGSLAHPHLLVGCSKRGKIYLIDRDNMGHFNAVSDSQIVQSFQLSPAFFGLPAYFNGRLYFQGVGDSLKAYVFTNGLLNTTPVSQSTDTLGFRGATPSISSSGNSNGIVWQIAIPAGGNASLRAYNATNLSHKLYDSYVNFLGGYPDQFPYLKFIVPTIANGKVYAGTGGSLNVFGLRCYFRTIRRNSGSGAIEMTLAGPAGYTITIQQSTNLVQWADLGQATSTGNGTFAFVDNPPAGGPVRFYRVRQ